MKKEYNMENVPSKSRIQQYPFNQEKTTKNNLYDEEFVSLINRLNDSIKNYYKVSRHNIAEVNTYISYYEQQYQSIDILINEIINTNQYQRLNDLYDMNNKNKELLIKLQENSNSSEKILTIFFEDAKILFKGMKMKRKQNLLEINNQNKNTLFKDNNYSTYNNDKANVKYNINNSGNKLNALIPINKIYIQIVQLLSKLSEFNVIINKTNSIKSNEYINLQNNIKRELDLFMKLVKNNLDNNMDNINTNIYSNNNNINITNESYGRRSRSQPHDLNKEIETLKKKNLIYEKKLKDLTNQINLYRKNNTRGSGRDADSDSKKNELDTNNLNLKIKKLEQIIKEKDALIMNFNNNLNPNINNIIKIKDNQILNLQQEINVYQKNESILNTEITDLNNKFQQKINQYENQILLLSNKNNSLSRIIMAKNNNVLKLQNENKELNMKLNNYTKTKNIISNIKVQNIDENSINDYNKIISDLKNEVETYKSVINQYEIKIIELSNNGINNNNMNVNAQNNNNANNANNANNFILQKKIEKLNKDIEMLANKNNIYEQKINVINAKNNQLNKENVILKKKEQLNEEKNNEYIKQIEEMSNNILSTNKILEQKDELIKQLTERNNIQNYKNQSMENNNEINNINKNDNNDVYNSEIRKLKIMNENFKKEVERLKINKNINLSKNNLLKDKIINGNDIKELQELNIQLLEENNTIHAQNEELLEKIKQLTLENQQIQESFTDQKKTISKLEGDINKKNEELEGLKTFIFKLQTQLENKDDNLLRIKKKMDGSNKTLEQFPSTDQNKNNVASKKNVNEDKSLDETKDSNTKNLLNKINEYEKKISNLQEKNKELQFKLEDKQVEKELSGFRTEDNNVSNYEEEFDLKRMVSGARDKNRSEDINIDYPGVQGIKDKHKELLQNTKMLEEQIKILINNINCNGKIKPQITQICQLMRIPAKSIQLIIAGKDKKRALGLID